MTVAYVVYADALHARRLAPAFHLVGKEVLGHGEQAFVGGNVVAQEGGMTIVRTGLGVLGLATVSTPRWAWPETSKG